MLSKMTFQFFLIGFRVLNLIMHQYYSHVFACLTSFDSVDDYLIFGETTTLKCIDKFTMGVINIFEAQYL